MAAAEWVQVTTRLTPDEVQRLEQIAKDNDRSVARELRRLIRQHLAAQQAEATAA